MNEAPCPFCSGPLTEIKHAGVCPKVREIEYYDNGRVKRVVFRGPNDWWYDWRPAEPVKPAPWIPTLTGPSTAPLPTVPNDSTCAPTATGVFISNAGAAVTATQPLTGMTFKIPVTSGSN